MLRRPLLAAGLACLCALHAPQVSAASMACSVNGHWREVAYAHSSVMQRYEPFKGCVAWTAYQFNLPEELLYSMLYVERGSINGKCRNNRNGTQDCGPAQINDIRLHELKRFGFTKNILKTQPCQNIWAMGYLLRREIEKADGNIWRGVGNYHYHYSVNRKVHEKYVNRIRGAWKTLLQTTEHFCLDQSKSAK